MKKGFLVFFMAAFALAAVGPAFAEDITQEQRSETKTLRKEIVRLKYVRATDLERLLYLYVSRDGHIQVSPNIPDVLTVSDTPENVEKILAAIREIDVKPADVLFTVQLVLGSEAEDRTDPDLQNDPIIKELRKLLRYKGYTLLDASLVRVVDRESSEVVLGRKAEFALSLRPDVAGDAKAAFIKTDVRLRTVTRPEAPAAVTPNIQPIVKNLIESSLNIKSGDKTVVGVSKLDGGDKGLILIISAKIVE